MTQNMYLDYRNRAAKNNKALKSRERTAEILGISESSLSNYETGRTKVVPAEMVEQMATIYNAPELRNIYCMSECPIGCHKSLAYSETSIEKVAVHLINSADPGILSDSMSKFIKIAADGQVDGSEREVLSEIADIFNKLTFALSEFGIFAERHGV